VLSLTGSIKLFVSFGLIAIGYLYILGTLRNWNWFVNPGKSSFIGSFLFGLAGPKALISFNYFCGALLILSGIGTLILI
jgi:hypothetical protein